MHIDRLVFVISGVLVLIRIALGMLSSTRWLLGAGAFRVAACGGRAYSPVHG